MAGGVGDPNVDGTVVLRSCISWHPRRSPGAVARGLGSAIVVAAIVVLIGYLWARAKTGCGDTPTSHGGTCVRKVGSRAYIGYPTEVEARPGLLIGAVVLAALIVVAALIYLLRPVRPNPIEVMEFERRVVAARSDLAARYAREPSAYNAHVLQSFDAEYERQRPGKAS
ncbi:hypothetical protein GTV32_15055 [Gordonia sp. SID5947]|uniref:hypothetical protein n=1 Tax=Gordonia sp. SID5947 TaxID=2690315 RepID=UPI00136E171C|nr:hypothetical protein [Gordonia sp. SID5947]MYR07538.1 hypothetical protein [Gordonia sp. SID5947]